MTNDECTKARILGWLGLLLMAGAALGSAPILAQTITLLPAAMIDSADVTVEQVARIEPGGDPEEADHVAHLVLRPAPAPGEGEELTMTALRGRLTDLGVNRAVWTVRGAAACRMTRVASADEQLGQLARRSEILRGGLAALGDDMPEELIPDSLAGCIRRSLVNHFQPVNGKLTLRFEAPDRPVLAMQQPQFRFELAVKRVTDSYVEVAVQVFPGAEKGCQTPFSGANEKKASDALSANPVKSASIRVRAELSTPVVVARRQINRDQVISPDDVHLATRQVGLITPTVTELAAAVGQQAKRVIKPDELIGPADLTPLALVSRNKLVTVYVRTGAMLIKTVGRAMQDGIYGQKIMVRNEASHQAYYVTVTGPDTVQLDGSRPPEDQRGDKPAPGRPVERLAQRQPEVNP